MRAWAAVMIGASSRLSTRSGVLAARGDSSSAAGSPIPGRSPARTVSARMVVGADSAGPNAATGGRSAAVSAAGRISIIGRTFAPAGAGFSERGFRSRTRQAVHTALVTWLSSTQSVRLSSGIVVACRVALRCTRSSPARTSGGYQNGCGAASESSIRTARASG